MNTMQEKGFALLDIWFNDKNSLSWGSKGYIVDKLSKKLGITKKLAAEIHKEWADKN